MMTKEEDGKVIKHNDGLYHLIVERYFATLHYKCGKKGNAGNHETYQRLVEDYEDVERDDDKVFCDMCHAEVIEEQWD